MPLSPKIRKHAKFCLQVRDRQQLWLYAICEFIFEAKMTSWTYFSSTSGGVVDTERRKYYLIRWWSLFCGTMNQIRCLKIEKIDLRRQKQLNDCRTAGRNGKWWWYVTIRHPTTPQNMTELKWNCELHKLRRLAQWTIKLSSQEKRFNKTEDFLTWPLNGRSGAGRRSCV